MSEEHTFLRIPRNIILEEHKDFILVDFGNPEDFILMLMKAYAVKGEKKAVVMNTEKTNAEVKP